MTYLKIVLTAIALLLAIRCTLDILPSTAQASNTVDVNIKSVGGAWVLTTLPVNIEQVGGSFVFNPLPVRVK